ncbi:MAG: cellulose biosynthesis protein BcsS [Pseudomonadota bacterium]
MADLHRQIMWGETWFGARFDADGYALYSGATVAPFSDIASPGLRLRATGGRTRYTYEGLRFINGANRQLAFEANGSFADALLGYQGRYGPLTWKLFAGYSYVVHETAPFDVTHPLATPQHGAKVVAEAWLNLPAARWLAIDLEAATIENAAALSIRLGQKVRPTLSFGLEAGGYLTRSGRGGRLALFARYAREWGEVSVAVGAAGEVSDTLEVDDVAPYVGLSVLTRF